MLLSSVLLNSVYAHSCFEAIVLGKTDPPLTLEAFRAYLRSSGAGEAELLQFWEWYHVYEERFNSLPPMVRSRARHPVDLRMELYPTLSSQQGKSNRPPSIASSTSPILEVQSIDRVESSSSSISKHAVLSSSIVGTSSVPVTSIISCMNSVVYDKREGVEILPSILETAPLTFDDDLNGLGITSDTVQQHPLTDNRSSGEWSHPDHTNHNIDKDHTEVITGSNTSTSTSTTINPTVEAMHVVATARDIPADISLQSVDSQKSAITDTSSVEYQTSCVRLDAGHPSNHPGRSNKTRKPPLQQEFNFALKRWFCTSPDDETNESTSSTCHTSIAQWRSRLISVIQSETGERPAPPATVTTNSAQLSKESTPSITSGVGVFHASSLDHNLQRRHHIYACNLPLPNTPAIRLALDELYQMANYTTHPDLFIPLVIEAKNRLVDYHTPRFVACLVRNISHRTANIRMFIATAVSLLGIVGVFICLLFHVKHCLRIIPLLIIVNAISSIMFSHFGICMYRMYRQRKRDLNSSRLQEPSAQQNEENQQQHSSRRRSSLASTGQSVPYPTTTSHGYSRCYDNSSLPYDTSVHGVYNTRKRLCLRLIAFTFLFAVILGSIIMLVPDIPLNN